MLKIDAKDRKILHELDMNARMPLAKLAKKLRLSRQVVHYRLQRLRSEEIIFGAITVFDTVTVGYNWYRVIFRLLNVTQDEKKELIESIKRHPYIQWVGEVGGNWDLVLNFICKDIFEFNKIFEGFIEAYGKFVMSYEILIYINIHDLQRIYIAGDSVSRKEFFHKMQFNGNIEPDELDKKIIREISTNATISLMELSERTNSTRITIKKRIEKMINNGLILGFRMMINPSLLGYQSHILFLGINRLDLKRETELYQYLKTIPNVSFLVKHIGKWRVGVEIETKDEKEFQDIFINIRGKFSDIITDYEICPIFRDHAINYFPPGNLD